MFDDGPRHPSHQVHADSVSQSVSRQNSGGILDVIIIRQNMDARITELPSSVASLRNTAENQMFAVAISPKHPRLIEPESSNELPIAVKQNSNQTSAFAQASSITISDRPVNRLFLFGFESIDRPNIRKVVETLRDVKQQIAGSANLQLPKQFCFSRTDPRNELNRR
jgi:hypothetical protein